MLFSYPVKPAHYRCVLPPRCLFFPDLAITETVDHRLNQCLFEAARRFGVR